MKKVLGFCVALFCVSGLTVAAPASLSISETTNVVQGMDSVRFMAINGKDRVLQYRMPIVNDRKLPEGTIVPVYSVENPFDMGKLPVATPLFTHLPTDRIAAVVLLGNKLTTKQISQAVGLNLTDNERVAAVQVAVWLAAQEMSQQYKLDESSVRNANVMTAARWLQSTAGEFISRKSQGMSVVDVVWPLPTMTVDRSKAKGNVSGQFNYYGPYAISATDARLTIRVSALMDNHALVDSIGGALLTELRVNQLFYVRVGRNLIADANMTFTAEAVAPDVRMHENYLYVLTEDTVVSCNLVIGNKNNTGVVQYVKYDEVTNTGIEGTVIEIRDMVGNLVATMTTDAMGEATSPELAIGSYTLCESRASEGYALDVVEKEAEIKGNGEFVQIVSKAVSSVGFVTFLCRDKSTTAPVGGSVFEVIDASGKVVTKIGFNTNGRCANIKLPQGKYELKEVISNTAFEYVVDRIKFDIESGERKEVEIEKTVAFSYTKFVVTDENGHPKTNAVLQLVLEDGSSFIELRTNKEGTSTISIPSGKYSVRTKGDNSTAPSKLQSFQVLPTKKNTIVEIGVNSYTAFVSGRVCGRDGEPLIGVGLVAVDDQGGEYSTTSTNFEGVYRLSNLPDKAVIFIMAHKAPYGFSGKFDDNRLITMTTENKKDLVLLSLDEYNSTLPDGEEVLKFEFYKLKAVTEPEVEEGEVTLGQYDADSSVSIAPTVVRDVPKPATPQPTTVSQPESAETGGKMWIFVIVGVCGFGVVFFVLTRRKKQRVIVQDGGETEE